MPPVVHVYVYRFVIDIIQAKCSINEGVLTKLAQRGVVVCIHSTVLAQ